MSISTTLRTVTSAMDEAVSEARPQEGTGALLYNQGKDSFVLLAPMDMSETIDAQVSFPIDLYGVIEQLAQSRGHSVSQEVVTLLTSLVPRLTDELAKETSEWEAASDEDWLAIERRLAVQEN